MNGSQVPIVPRHYFPRNDSDGATTHLLYFDTVEMSSGKPYILSVSAGEAFPDQRAQGFTVAVVSVFSSVEDMVYYDNECQAHAALKAFAKTVHQGVMMVYFESIFD